MFVVSSKSALVDKFSDANIDLAIRQCREEKNQTLLSGRHMQMVKESLNEGYCDVSGHDDDMAFICGSIQILIRCTMRSSDLGTR